VLYLGIRLDIISDRHSICRLVLGVFKVRKILCIATQIPYTWFLSFLRGFWTLPEMGTVQWQEGTTDPLMYPLSSPVKNWLILKTWFLRWQSKLQHYLYIAYHYTTHFMHRRVSLLKSSK
jgi:hypothetical protein